MTTTNITCPHCSATNRLPTERLADNPKCGRCKQPLFYGAPMELTPSNFEPLMRNNQTPILVDCWAPWCGPCRTFAPVFEQAAGEFEPRLRLAKLNTEQYQTIAGQWQIRSIPTLILLHEGRELDRLSGALPLPQLRQWLQQKGI
ncbi:thioredoxin TrxC [Halioxenophilus sp. WMMB6]|uniref:thioredoxin TrxC n=1 Tax=Halioxenophilus sp. WMMB6 TaxID=3073815 RepID=UPI00295EA034|nr:thioredoxin TrxC [Halioxenophilus sp. WMMB6]